MKKYSYILFVLLLSSLGAKAQELNAKVSINSSKIQSADRSAMTDLETKLNQLMNGTKWTDASFAEGERIACTFMITLNSVSNTTYSGDVQITLQRPVYNSTYTTSLFNFKDPDFTFNYNRENLTYSQNNITSDLVALMAFYSYIVIGLDYDSFALNGGRSYFGKAMDIGNASQSFDSKGWKAFDSDRNRYALALALTEDASSIFHSMWYNYHRLGLDVMSDNLEGARTQVIQSISDIDKLHDVRPSSVLVTIFGDAKLDELSNIYSKETPENKQSALTIIQKIYPTRAGQLKGFK